MTENLDYINECIIKAIDILTVERMKQAKLDTTIQGRIVTSEGNGFYTVCINKHNYAHVPCSSDMTFEANESVWITVPQQVWEEKFISGRRR